MVTPNVKLTGAARIYAQRPATAGSEVERWVGLSRHSENDSTATVFAEGDAVALCATAGETAMAFAYAMERNTHDLPKAQRKVEGRRASAASLSNERLEGWWNMLMT